MSEFNTETITDRAGTGKPDLTFGFKINGSDSGINPFLHTESANEPSNPNNGDAWLDTTNNVYKVYINNEWKDWFGTTQILNYGDKASRVGFGTQQLNSIHTFDITTLGNASDWKDLTRTSSARGAAASNSTYGFFFGGNVDGGNGSTDVNNIDYYAFANNTNASDFGDLTSTCSDNSACSNGITACIQLAFDTGVGELAGIDYITMATTGNASDFGDTTHARRPLGNVQVSNGTRGLFAGGYSSSYTNGSNIIDYITIATPGNATDFGDLTVSRYGLTGCGSGSGDRGLFMGGYPSSAYRMIDYVTISTTGNATNFGGIFSGGYGSHNYYVGSCNNATRAVFSASHTSDRMEYVTMATTGNAADFGDQTSTTNNRFQALTSGSPS